MRGDTGSEQCPTADTNAQSRAAFDEPVEPMTVARGPAAAVVATDCPVGRCAAATTFAAQLVRKSSAERSAVSEHRELPERRSMSFADDPAPGVRPVRTTPCAHANASWHSCRSNTGHPIAKPIWIGCANIRCFRCYSNNRCWPLARVNHHRHLLHPNQKHFRFAPLPKWLQKLDGRATYAVPIHLAVRAFHEKSFAVSIRWPDVDDCGGGCVNGGQRIRSKGSTDRLIPFRSIVDPSVVVPKVTFAVHSAFGRCFHWRCHRRRHPNRCVHHPNFLHATGMKSILCRLNHCSFRSTFSLISHFDWWWAALALPSSRSICAICPHCCDGFDAHPSANLRCSTKARQG